MTQNFDPKQYIQAIIVACDLQNEKPEVLAELRELLELRLSERIIDTVTSSLREEDMKLMTEIAEKNPDWDPMDVLMVIAEEIPGMSAKMKKALDDFFEEATANAVLVEEIMKERVKTMVKA